MLYEYVNTVGDLAPSEIDASSEDTTPPSIPLPAGDGWLLDTMTVGKRVMYYTWRRLKDLKTNFQGGGTGFNVTSGVDQVTTKDITWDHDVSLFAFHFSTAEENRGDIIRCIVAPELDLEAVIGAGVTGQSVITQNVSANDTVINVSPYVLSILDVGYYVTLKDDLGQESARNMIDAIDFDNNTITLKDPVGSAYTAANNMTMLRDILMGKEYVCLHPGTFHLGDIVKNPDVNAGDGAQIPKGTVVRIEYVNKDGAANKWFGFGWQLNYGVKR